VAGYYIDEPFEEKHWYSNMVCTVGDYIGQVNNINQLRYVANPLPLYMGSWALGENWVAISCPYIWVNCYDVVLNYTNVYIMCDKYETGSLTDRWSAFRSRWSNKNSGNWVHLHTNWPGANNSYTKWDVLIPHANSLGVNNIAIWGDSRLMTDVNASSKFHNFCSYAFGSYFLRGFTRYMTIYEKCDQPACQGCEPYGDSPYWYVESIIYGNTWTEIFP